MFGSDYFMYDSNHNYVSSGIFKPGTTLYLLFSEGDSKYSNIKFSIDGYLGKKRITSNFTQPAIGETIIVTITGSTRVADV